MDAYIQAGNRSDQDDKKLFSVLAKVRTGKTYSELLAEQPNTLAVLARAYHQKAHLGITQLIGAQTERWLRIAARINGEQWDVDTVRAPPSRNQRYLVQSLAELSARCSQYALAERFIAHLGNPPRTNHAYSWVAVAAAGNNDFSQAEDYARRIETVKTISTKVNSCFAGYAALHDNMELAERYANDATRNKTAAYKKIALSLGQNRHYDEALRYASDKRTLAALAQLAEQNDDQEKSDELHMRSEPWDKNGRARAAALNRNYERAERLAGTDLTQLAFPAAVNGDYERAEHYFSFSPRLSYAVPSYIVLAESAAERGDREAFQRYQQRAPGKVDYELEWACGNLVTGNIQQAEIELLNATQRVGVQGIRHIRFTGDIIALFQKMTGFPTLVHY